LIKACKPGPLCTCTSRPLAICRIKHRSTNVPSSTEILRRKLLLLRGTFSAVSVRTTCKRVVSVCRSCQHCKMTEKTRLVTVYLPTERDEVQGHHHEMHLRPVLFRLPRAYFNMNSSVFVLSWFCFRSFGNFDFRVRKARLDTIPKVV
jgi:hypothetical protein